MDFAKMSTTPRRWPLETNGCERLGSKRLMEEEHYRGKSSDLWFSLKGYKHIDGDAMSMTSPK